MRPVKSYKHIVDSSGLITNVTSVTDLIISRDNPILTQTNSVQTASTVHGIFLHVEISLAIPAAGVDRFYFIVFKNPGNNLLIPDATQTGADDNKRHIIHQEMMMLNKTPVDPAIFPRTMFKGVLKIPPRMKRFGQSDRLQLALKGPDVTGQANFCAQCIYKEFR